jgi:fluoroacetyl-CoA thioesterase
MEYQLKTGIQLTMEKRVTPDDTAKRHGSGLVEVFATPAMIAFMEKACLELVKPFLPEHMNTVGTEVNIRHMKATPVGQMVNCTSELIEVDDRRLVFEVKAWDEEGLIGEGRHSRFIIDTEKFMLKVLKHSR